MAVSVNQLFNVEIFLSLNKKPFLPKEQEIQNNLFFLIMILRIECEAFNSGAFDANREATQERLDPGNEAHKKNWL